ncbi:hypothetical protein E1B28_009939 [Marasmius oreades]|uniref:DBF4-type domain-containing protein n=1 Tax=Marasmius oreades TaxID=181124 RepID=A0A9P7UQM0_9AGAR|nr:uncharacterized protein E1B28_009939 [Marasmius oreades]KAG7090857.1 hypothetical protein E1B28_009939 [Marasmius oreades]
MATAERSSIHLRVIPRMPMSPSKTRVPSGTKRARSPGVGAEEQSSRAVLKRARPTVATPTSQKIKSREKKYQEVEFREKYSRAMPSWTFHFDMTDIADETLVNKLKRRLRELGGNYDNFFSKDITHFICNDADRSTKAPEEAIEKENRSHHTLSRSTFNLRKSPSKHTLMTEVPEDASSLAKARTYNMKIWTLKKLDSVLARCLDQPLLIPSKQSHIAPLSNSNPNQGRSLTRLLQSEKINGSSERDSSQRRPDYHYFSKGSYFVLVEDMRQELATIAVQEYPQPRRNSGKFPWPVLHCHPQARGPFVPFDERERRRWEKGQTMEKECRLEQEAYRRKKMKQFEDAFKLKAAQNELRRSGDLRRSVSMNNLRRQSSFHEREVPEDGDRDSIYESANASGYLASGNGVYMAASGNSVHITSTTGTTSTTSGHLRRQNLPPNLQMIANQEITTSRKATRALRERKGDEMGPPAILPERHALRKSKSTNSMRLIKREEGTKPGYCESCRMKFEDFKLHIVCSRHRKFAANDANFSQLDCVLDRVRRKTVAEVRSERLRTRKTFSLEKAETSFITLSDESEMCIV